MIDHTFIEHNYLCYLFLIFNSLKKKIFKINQHRLSQYIIIYGFVFWCPFNYGAQALVSLAKGRLLQSLNSSNKISQKDFSRSWAPTFHFYKFFMKFCRTFSQLALAASSVEQEFDPRKKKTGMYVAYHFRFLICMSPKKKRVH